MLLKENNVCTMFMLNVIVHIYFFFYSSLQSMNHIIIYQSFYSSDLAFLLLSHQKYASLGDFSFLSLLPNVLWLDLFSGASFTLQVFLYFSLFDTHFFDISMHLSNPHFPFSLQAEYIVGQSLRIHPPDLSIVFLSSWQLFTRLSTNNLKTLKLLI